MDEQLRGLPQLPVLRALSHVHVHRLRLRGFGIAASIPCHGEKFWGEPLVLVVNRA